MIVQKLAKNLKCESFQILLFFILYLIKKRSISSENTFTSIIKILLFLKYAFTIKNYQRDQSISLYYNKNSDLINNLLTKLPTLNKKKFVPNFLFSSSIGQTIASTVLPINKNITLKRQVIEDSTEQYIGISLSWVQQKDIKEEDYQKDILIFVLPGLTGSAQDSYLNNLATAFLKKKFKVVVYNYRLLNEEIQFNHEDHHVCLTSDLQFTFQYLKKQNPNLSIYAVGHSYGANQIVNYLGTYKNESLVKGAVSLGNPFCFTSCVKHIDNTIYDLLLTYVLQQKIKELRHTYERQAKMKGFDLKKAHKAWKVRDFDDAFTKKCYGFKTVDDYYHNYGSKSRVKDITVPLLAINAKDDGISAHSALEFSDFQQNPNLILAVTDRGGHIGWVEGNIFNMKHWFPKPVVEFIEALIEKDNKKQEL